MEQNQLFEKVLKTIKQEIDEADFLTLFKKTALLSLGDNVATIAAPSGMIIDLIQKKFLTLLTDTFEKHAHEKIKIIFVSKTIPAQSSGKQTNNAPLFTTIQDAKPLLIGHLPRVRPDFTFQNIAVSSSNQLAFVSATNVAKNLGGSYNPLFMYGPVGVGKTHLMQAIANEVYQKDPSKKIIYITSEEFTNEVVEAIRNNQTHLMKKKFRSASLLIIDDVQFIAGKDKVQEELFHTFNILVDNSSQIVLSSDRPPQEIKKLEARLSSRFSGGLTVDIEPPDFELKTAILLIKAKKYGFELLIEVAKIIATQVEDTRSLEGALLRIMTEASTQGVEITQELALKTLKKKPKEERTRFHPDEIVRHVCEFYNLKPTQIKGPKRDATLVWPRQVAMYLLKKELGLTFNEIGNILGGRDHTTIMYGVEKVGEKLTSQARLSEEIVGITKVLRE